MSNLTQQRREMAEEMMRDAICTATVQVLSDVGYSSVTMDRVADAAGVSKGTLYNYYKDKDALMLAVVDLTFRPLTEEMDRIFSTPQSTRSCLLQAAWTVLAGMEERRAVGEVLCRDELTPAVEDAMFKRIHQFKAQLTGAVLKAIENGEMAIEGITAETGGRMLHLALHGMMDERLKHPEDAPSLEDDVKAFETFIINTWFRS